VTTISNVLKIILFFLGLWGERNSARAKKKKEVAKEVLDAMAETNPKLQAAMLNSAIQSVNRLSSKK
jgi:CRISPR/Cas system-associated protein Csm6